MTSSNTPSLPKRDTLPACIRGLMDHFEEMDLKTVDDLDAVYAPGVLFQDPVHKIEGREGLKRYFLALNKNLVEGKFDFTSVDVMDGRCFMQWVMRVRLKRPKKTIVLHGLTLLEYGELITFHRDYFDLGEMVYEHVPILGGILRRIKKKLAKP